LVLGFVVVVVLVALLVGFRRGTSVPAPGPGPAGSSPAGLRELVEMHDRGALTDEEFAAAKRHLLGL
ncbi:MAG: SHOCT domain-containing protein, partial [Candidatus Limnocylindrales bacterium]